MVYEVRKIREKKQGAVPGRWLAGLAFFLLIWLAVERDFRSQDTSLGMAFGNSLSKEFAMVLYDQFLPLASMEREKDGFRWLFQRGMESLMPLYGVAEREREAAGDNAVREHLGKKDVRPALLRYEDLLQKNDMGQSGGKKPDGEPDNLQELLQAENEAAAAVPFETHDKRIEINREELKDYETLVRSFYTIDANTMAGSDQLDVNRLSGKDMRIDRTVDGPQILIYHTHSREAFADSTAGDDMTGVMGVGAHLAEVLRTEYGYQVMHYMGQYDTEGRDNAYGNALPDIERVLAENPTIQVVIDLHRDQMPEETRLVINLDGRPTARFMFFNGLSRTRKTGDIAYLKNEYIEDNLAFSFQMELAAQEYYPGLTRKIYLKGYRYNMHVCPRTLLVELGAQNNTVEEAMNACEPLAHLLDIVIGGD